VRNHEYLLDLNMDTLETLIRITGLNAKVSHSEFFEPAGPDGHDFRYKITPKKNLVNEVYDLKEYFQVFSNKYGFVPGLSVIDLIFNMGPDSTAYLKHMN